MMRSLPGRLVRGVFGLAFAAAGALFAWIFLRSVVTSAEESRWPAQTCRVASATAGPNVRGNSGFVAEFRYAYPAEGGEALGTNRFHRASFGEVQELLDRYPVGSSIPGKRNPADGKVNLEMSGERTGGFLLIPLMAFPLLFVGIGLRDVWRALRGSPDADRAAGSGGRLGWIAGVGFGAVFFAVGVFATNLVLVRPLQAVMRAKDWQRTPCVIEHSRVVTSRGSKGGTTYQAEILYRYEFAGAVHRSDRTTFAAGGISGWKHSADYVEKMAPGVRASCYVDPAHPDQAVLDRDDSGVLSPALIVLGFPVAGVWILVRSWKQRPGAGGT